MGPSWMLLCCFLLLVPSLRGQEPDTCPWGWVAFEDNCYRFFPRELSWRRAEAFCQRFGTDVHLASVHSDEDHKAIATLLATSLPGEDHEEEVGEDGIWIGLHRPLGSRSWQWSDGSDVDFGSWHQQSGSWRRACIALQDTSDSMTWFSDSCSDRKPFICKSSA